MVLLKVYKIVHLAEFSQSSCSKRYNWPNPKQFDRMNERASLQVYEIVCVEKSEYTHKVFEMVRTA